MYVKTHQPYYYPGNKVLGKIYIRVTAPMQARTLTVDIKGTETSSFRTKVTTGHGDKRKTKTVYVKNKSHIINFSGTAMTFEAPL